MSHFGANIKKIRTVKKLNQARFAELFDLTRSAVGAYEEGRAEAKIDKVLEIAEYFGLDLDNFLRRHLTLNEIVHYDKQKDKLTDNFDYNTIYFVSSQKIKQYAKNFKDKEFIKRLPKISVPNTENNYRAFQLKNVNHFLDGDILICEPMSKKIVAEKYYLLIMCDRFEIVEKVPGKIHFEEAWTVKSVISNNMSKFAIIEQLAEINKKLGDNPQKK